MSTLHFTEILVIGTIVSTFEMTDRRPGAASSSRPTRWCLQMQLEDALFGKNAAPTTGAFYRLLGKTPGAKGRALCLRHKGTAIANGLVSAAEWARGGVAASRCEYKSEGVIRDRADPSAADERSRVALWGMETLTPARG